MEKMLKDIEEFTLQDIIEILPEFIEEKEIGKFNYELVIRKHEICYESYDTFDSDGDQYVKMYFSTDQEEYNSLLDCAVRMLKWCLNHCFVKLN